MMSNYKRLFPIALLFVAFWLTSCEQSYKGKPPSELFDSMSEKDSIALVHEIIDSFRVELYSSSCYDVPPADFFNTVSMKARMVYAIKVNTRKQKMVGGKIGPSIINGIKYFYLANLELSSEEVHRAVGNPRYRTYNFPFYTTLTAQKMHEELNKAQKLLIETKESGHASADYIGLIKRIIEMWKRKIELLEILKTDHLKENHIAEVTVDYPKESPPVMDSVLVGFLYLRDHYSQNYFDESYREIFHRYKLTQKADDLKKIEAINDIRPLNIIDIPYCLAQEGGCMCYPPIEAVPPPVERIP